MNEDPRDEPGEINTGNGQFESDTQRIVHRHLENKDDVISEEDIRNVRVGMVPPEILSTHLDRKEEMEDQIKNVNDSEDKDPNDEPITPYDMID